MAKAVITSHIILNSESNSLHDGDCIDLTSENETQCNVEDDVVLVSQTKSGIPLPIGTPRPHKSSPVTKALGAVSSISQQNYIVTKGFLQPPKSRLNPSTSSRNTKSGSEGQNSVQIPSRLSFKSTGGVISVRETPLHDHIGVSQVQENTVTKFVETKNPKSSKNAPSMQDKRVLNDIITKMNKKTGKNVVAIITSINKCGGQSKNTKTNIPPVIKQYRKIKPSPPKPNTASSKTASQNVENCILVPTTSETNRKTDITKTTSTESVDDDVILVSTQSEKVVEKPNKIPRASEQNAQISKNDVRLLADMIRKRVISMNPGIATQRNQTKTVLTPIQKDGQKSCLILAPVTNIILNGQVGTVTPPGVSKTHSSILNKPVQDRPLGNSLSVENHEAEVISNDEDVEIIENGVASFHQNESQKIGVPNRNNMTRAGKEQGVYFLMYPLPGDQNSTIVAKRTEEEINEVVNTQTSESSVSGNNEEIYIDSGSEDPLEDTRIEPSCLVTPVDISKILSEAKTPRKGVKARCNCADMRNKALYYKGFTKSEMRKSECYKYLQILINQNETKINELKKSIISHEDNFIHCGETLNNFLPEISKCDDDDTDNFTIEYNNVEDQLTAEIYNSETLPIITDIVSEVNDEVEQIKTKHDKTRQQQSPTDLQSKLAKPEAALKLIKKGLELIKSWSKESYSVKEKASEPLPKKRRGRPCAAKETVTTSPQKAKKTRVKKCEAKQPEQPQEPVKRGRGRKKKMEEQPIEIAKKQVNRRKKKEETNTEVITVSGRGRKRKKVEFFDPTDNELFLIKKVDILNHRRRK